MSAEVGPNTGFSSSVNFLVTGLPPRLDHSNGRCGSFEVKQTTDWNWIILMRRSRCQDVQRVISFECVETH